MWIIIGQRLEVAQNISPQVQVLKVGQPSKRREVGDSVLVEAQERQLIQITQEAHVGQATAFYAESR